MRHPLECAQIAGQTRLSKSRCIAFGGPSAWSRTGSATSSSRPIRSSWRRCATSWDLYLHPPENAVVLCVNEKSQIQALERTQPMLPIRLGYVEGVTHGYRPHGTTTLFASLDTAKGMVLTRCRQRHRHHEYLDVLRQIDNNVPSDLDVHLMVDKYATHKLARPVDLAVLANLEQEIKFFCEQRVVVLQTKTEQWVHCTGGF